MNPKNKEELITVCETTARHPNQSRDRGTPLGSGAVGRYIVRASVTLALLLAAALTAQTKHMQSKLIIVDPGHFHATLLQKDMYPWVDPRVTVYAPLGPDLLDYLNRISLFNSRSGNPTRTALETCLAALDGGAHALAYASGLAAETGALSLLAPGDHVVAGADLYGGTVRLLDTVLAPLGIETTYVDGGEEEAFAAAVRPATRLVWVETPSNPLLEMTDIAAVARMAHDAGALLAVDNTFATPALQRPLDLGADIVAYSTTKYVGGHSDVVGAHSWSTTTSWRGGCATTRTRPARSRGPSTRGSPCVA